MVNVGIIGGTGYTGVELMRLLANHPMVELKVITSRSNAGTAVSEMFPNLRGKVDLKFTEPSIESYKQCDLDLEKSLSKAFGNVVVTPTSFLINSSGEIIYQHVGRLDFSLINQKLKALIG